MHREDHCCSAHGAVLRRYSRTVSKLTGDEAAAVARFEAHLRAAGRSASTVRSYGTLAREFTAFSGTRGGMAHYDSRTVGAFVATLAGYRVKTAEQKLCALGLQHVPDSKPMNWGYSSAGVARSCPAPPRRLLCRVERQASFPAACCPGEW